MVTKRRKHILRKTVFRAIRQSLARYLAIVGIIALGAGFFTGLKVTKTSMLKTGEQYLTDTNFYDFRLLSTYGWTEESVASLARTDGIADAEGSVSTDVLATVSGRELVVHAMSLTGRINTPQLTSGRLPEAADECVVDDYSLAGLSIGDRITLSDANEEDRLDMFSGTEYTVVGTVRSPLYINYERGTTTLGTGTVSGFLILSPAGFATDYYTEIYLTTAEKATIYSDAYDAIIDGLTDPVTEAAEAAAGARFTTLKADAEQELADARKEYEDGLAEYEDGLKEYNDGLAEYEDGLREYEDGLAEYEDGVSTLASTKRSTLKKISDGLAQVDAAEADLNEKKSTAEAGIAQAQAAIPQAEAAVVTLTAQRAAVEADTTLDEATRAATLAQIDAGLTEAQATLDSLNTALATAQAGLAQIEAGLSECAATRSSLTEARATAQAKFRQAQQKLDDASEELADAKEELDDAEAELADAKEELDDGKAELDDAEGELADAEQELSDLSAPDTYVLDRTSNVGYVCFESDSEIVNGVSRVFPFFFFAVAALVCVTTMNRMVADERGQIGTFKSLGYGYGAIMSRYLFYSGSASLLGCIFGTLVGSYVFPKVIWQGYMIMYSMPQNVTVFDVGLITLSCVSYLVLSLGVTYFSCRSELSEPAAELIRPKSPKPGKRILLEHIGFLWNRLSFLRKVALRNVFRYHKRLIMMMLGIGGCMALLLTGLGLNDSITSLAERQYTEICTYDASVNFSDDITGQEDAFLSSCGDGVTGAAFLSSSTVDLATDAYTGSVSLVSVDSFSELDGLMDFHLDGVTVPAPEDGCCIISENVADRYGVSIGDTITLTRDTTQRLPVKVTGIYENVIYNYVYTTSATVRAAYGEAPKKVAYLGFAEGADVHATGAVIQGADDVVAITLTEDMLTRVNSMLDSMKYIVMLVIACAAALDFIVLFNLTNINIIERVREIATIKVLGFNRRETSQYIMRENVVLTVCGGLAGIPLGILLLRYVMSQIKIDMIAFKPLLEPRSYVIAIALAFVFTFSVNLIMKPRLERINMAEALKSVE